MGLSKDAALIALKQYRVEYLYYFSLAGNFESICVNGILPNNVVVNKSLNAQTFAIPQVQNRRHNKVCKLNDGRDVHVHDAVPLYFVSRTPTLYARRHLQKNIFFVLVDKDVLFSPGVRFSVTDGNAASNATQFFHSLESLRTLSWDVIYASSWVEHPDGRRKRCAEVLVYPKITTEYFKAIVVNNTRLKNQLQNTSALVGVNIPIIEDVKLFFSY